MTSEISTGREFRTRRLRLVPATVDLARAEIAGGATLGALLGAAVPSNWPPESAADALDYFLALLEANPGHSGWLGWYAIADAEGAGPTLVASGGFFGPPDGEGTIETGYSVLPQYQRRGYATEMIAGLIGWATSHASVRRVVARTDRENVGSRKVLGALGFEEAGPTGEPGELRYVRESAGTLRHSGVPLRP